MSDIEAFILGKHTQVRAKEILPPEKHVAISHVFWPAKKRQRAVLSIRMRQLIVLTTGPRRDMVPFCQYYLRIVFSLGAETYIRI